MYHVQDAFDEMNRYLYSIAYTNISILCAMIPPRTEIPDILAAYEKDNI